MRDLFFYPCSSEVLMFIVADIISGFYFTVLRFVHVFGKRLKVPVGSEEVND